jgi:hypothetical protein
MKKYKLINVIDKSVIEIEAMNCEVANNGYYYFKDNKNNDAFCKVPIEYYIVIDTKYDYLIKL